MKIFTEKAFIRRLEEERCKLLQEKARNEELEFICRRLNELEKRVDDISWEQTHRRPPVNE